MYCAAGTGSCTEGLVNHHWSTGMLNKGGERGSLFRSLSLPDIISSGKVQWIAVHGTLRFGLCLR